MGKTIGASAVTDQALVPAASSPSVSTKGFDPGERLTAKLARILAESDGLRVGAPEQSVKPWMRHARLAASFFDGYYGNEIALLREKLSAALAAGKRHSSDCSVYNAPAYEPGPCDCGEAVRAAHEIYLASRSDGRAA